MRPGAWGTPYAPDEVRMLDDTAGNPINPGARAGDPPRRHPRADSGRGKFPTAWVVAERILLHAAHAPGVYLSWRGAARAAAGARAAAAVQDA